MKILIINNAYQQFGSTDAVVLQEKELLQEHGEEVLVYSRSSSELASGSLGERFLLPVNSVYSMRTRRELTQLVREHRPDVAYVHNFLPLISPSVYHTLYACGVPCVQILHEFRLFCANSVFYTGGQVCERCKNGNYLHAIRHRCYKDSYLASIVCSAVLSINRSAGMLEKITAFLCLTEFSKHKLMEVGVPAEKLFVRPLYLDCSSIQPQFGKGSYVLYMGRLSEEKGVRTLLRLASIMKEVEFKIAGTGPLESTLRSFAMENGLKNVEFVGVKSGREKWDLLLGSRLVVAPSECYETFGLVAIEAYAAGKPVIGTNMGSLPYVIENGKSGLLFSPGCVEELQGHIQSLLEAPGLADEMGRYGRQLVETKYSPGENYNALMRIFRELVKSPGSPTRPQNLFGGNRANQATEFSQRINL